MAGRKKFRQNRVALYRAPDVLIRTRPKGDPIVVDHDEADRMLQDSIERGGLAHMPPKGVCYDCDKKIPPMRKLCGSCLSKRDNRTR